MKKILLIFLVLFSSCTVHKKVVETETRTTHILDTIYRVNVVNDTVHHTAYMYDTLKLTTKYFNAIVYNDTIKKRIVADVSENDFSVPVQIKETTVTKQETKTKDKIPKWYWFSIGVIAMFLLFFNFKKR